VLTGLLEEVPDEAKDAIERAISASSKNLNLPEEKSPPDLPAAPPVELPVNPPPVDPPVDAPPVDVPVAPPIELPPDPVPVVPAPPIDVPPAPPAGKP
jgi:hypothetical protein